MSGDNTSASPIEAIETALPASPEPDNAVAGDPKPHVEESSESKPPQSALTAKFTEAEWDVLKEFRVSNMQSCFDLVSHQISAIRRNYPTYSKKPTSKSPRLND